MLFLFALFLTKNRSEAFFKCDLSAKNKAVGKPTAFCFMKLSAYCKTCYINY